MSEGIISERENSLRLHHYFTIFVAIYAGLSIICTGFCGAR